MHRRLFTLIGLLLVVMLAAGITVGCGGGGEGTEGTSDEGGEKQEAKSEDYTLVVGMKHDVMTLDPAMHRNRETETVIRNMFDGLVTRTTEMEIVPEIAESWEAASPTEWVFKIRKGITFHNGEKLDAEDVVFTFERLITEGAIDGQTSPRKGLLGSLEKIEKIDDYTVKFILSEPWPVFIRMLPHQQIVPKDYIEEKGNQYFAEHPVGAGPFKFVRGNLKEEIVMERYEDYYGGSPDLPPVGPAPAKQVVFKVMPETSSRVAALQRGEAHIIQAVPPSLVEQLKSDPNVKVKTCTGTRVHFVAMNNSKPPFDDVRVRKAMNYATDMEEIVETILGGNGYALAGPLLPMAFGYNDELKPYGYDPEKAKQLLKEAGYENGFKLVIDCRDDKKEIAEALASQLRKVGVDASVRVWDWGVLKPKILNGERSMAVVDWGNSTLDPYGILNPQFITNGRGNYAIYSNPRVDELLKEAGSIADQEKRKAMYKEAQQIIYDDAAWIFGYGTNAVEACTANVENWEPSPDSRINLHDVKLKQ